MILSLLLWSIILKLLKVTNLQYLYKSQNAISLQHLKKEVRNGGQFLHADKRQSFYKLVLSFSVELARHIQNTQNRKLVKFLQCIKKKLSQLLCVLLWCKRFRYFKGIQSCSLLLVFRNPTYFAKVNLMLNLWYLNVHSFLQKNSLYIPYVYMYLYIGKRL